MQGKPYHKIQSVFMRDPETKFKTFTDEYSTPEIGYLADNEWQWTEKIDGTNIRVHWDGHEVTFGGRTERSAIPARLYMPLSRMFTAEKFEFAFPNNHIFDDSDEGVTLYGEGYGEGIQKVGSDYLSDACNFILFDVSIGDMWLRQEDVEDIASKLEVASVPVVGLGPIGAAIELVKAGFKSSIGKADAEGLVLRPSVPMFDRMGRRVIAKLKCRDFPRVS